MEREGNGRGGGKGEKGEGGREEGRGKGTEGMGGTGEDMGWDREGRETKRRKGKGEEGLEPPNFNSWRRH